MKGITPIISIIILLLITIALAGVAYTFLMGQMYTRISGSFTVTSGGAFCTASGITVQVTNTGQANLVTGDFTIVRVGGADVSGSLQNVTIAPSEAAVILNNYNCGGSCPSGSNAIDIGTESTVEHTTVFCP